VTAFFAVITGFALIWHIAWLAILGLVCAALTLLAFGWTDRVEMVVSGKQLADADELGCEQQRHWRGRPGAGSHRSCLRLLDFLAERHYFVLGTVRVLCGVVGTDCRSPSGHELFELRHVGIETVCCCSPATPAVWGYSRSSGVA